MRDGARRAGGVVAAAVVGAGVLGVGVAQADDFTVGGAFTAVATDVLLIEFTSPGGAFTAFTSQWENADPPFPNGFDAQLQLFDGTGPTATFSTEGDDGGFGFSATIGGTTFTGGDFDSLLDLVLAAGDYTLGLTNWDNDSIGPTLADGYDGFGGLFVNGPEFRVHLLGVEGIEVVEAPGPVSVSGPFDGDMMM